MSAEKVLSTAHLWTRKGTISTSI